MSALTDDSPSIPTRDVVFALAFETWTEARGREIFRPPGRLLTTLATHAAVGKLLVANPFQSWPVRAARRLSGRLDEAPFDWTRPGTALVSPYRLRRRNPTALGAAKRNFAAYDRTVRHAAEKLGMDQPAVITANPLLAAFAPLEWAHSVTFYALDDYAAHPAYTAYEQVYEEAYRVMRERGTRVCAVSKPLLERLAPQAPSAVVANGVDPGEWVDPGPPPDWFDRLGHPRIVYTGVLDVRLDWDVVKELALRHREGTVVLAGDPWYIDEVDPIGALDNVKVVPHLNRADLVGVIAGADVCVIPHIRTRVTESMSPLKLYEYLAGGRPVVATDLPPIHDINSRVKLAKNTTEFIDHVDRALEMGPMPETERRRFIEANSWARRFDQILSIALA